MRSGGFYIRAHIGSRVRKISSPKRAVWALKWPARLEKTKVIAITAQISMSRHIRLVFRSWAPHPCMDTTGCLAKSREETVNKEHTKINLESELIKTLKASENKLRFRRFHRRWKAIGELS